MTAPAPTLAGNGYTRRVSILRAVSKFASETRTAELVRLTKHHAVLLIADGGGRVEARFHRSSGRGFGAWAEWRLAYGAWDAVWVEGPEREGRL